MYIEGNTITYSVDVTISIYCPMRFESYPMDHQICPFQVGSYAYNSSYITFALKKLEKNDQMKTSVLDYTSEITTLSKEYTVFAWGYDGNFSLTGFQMILHRKIYNYIINFYVPSGLFVIVSWVNYYFIQLIIDSQSRFPLHFRLVFWYLQKLFPEGWLYW